MAREIALSMWIGCESERANANVKVANVNLYCRPAAVVQIVAVKRATILIQVTDSVRGKCWFKYMVQENGVSPSPDDPKSKALPVPQVQLRARCDSIGFVPVLFTNVSTL